MHEVTSNAEEPSTCIPSNEHQGATLLVAKRSLIVKRKINEKMTQHCKHGFMVSTGSFKSSPIYHDVHLVNYGPF